MTKRREIIMLIPQESFFEGLGFVHMPDLSCTGCHKGPDGRYYHVDHFSRSYVIELAETEDKARLNCFDDTFLFPDFWEENEIIKEIRDRLVKMSKGEK